MTLCLFVKHSTQHPGSDAQRVGSKETNNLRTPQYLTLRTPQNLTPNSASRLELTGGITTEKNLAKAAEVS
jgi:hypothetical protein